MTSNARIRLFGRSTFRMVYDYVSIAGQSTGSRVALRDEQ
jgi:hypothetical protein